MEDSVFSKIIKGEIPSHKIYEDEKTLAFLDIRPVQPGQVVVVSKLQVNFVWDLPAEDYAALMSTVQKVGQHLRESFPEKQRIAVRIEGFDVNNHAHVVLIPSNNPAEFNAHPNMEAEPDHEALAKLAESLRF
ncbi:MAG: putative Histidine triad protein [Candidatus Saccharibacteria bacterium]|nr:putative Histidine triad protein [Candidatus Saccharibacteria bacterium]